MIIGKKYITLIFFALFLIKIEAQNNTMYFMHGIKQSTQLNPAIQHKCKLFIGIPVLSTFQFNFNNTGFALGDVIGMGTGSKRDSLVLSINELDKIVKNKNYLKTEMQIAILSAGYRYKNYYFTLDISNKTDIKIGYPKNLIELKNGNADYIGDLNFMTLSPSASLINYNEIALGVSKKIHDGLTIGVKLKRLLGTVNLKTKSTMLTLSTDSDIYQLKMGTNIELNSTFPITPSYDDEGLIESVETKNIDIMKDFVLTKNKGWGLDFGFDYKYTEKINIYASVLDLGYIKWKNNTNSIKITNYFTYDGIDLVDFMKKRDTIDYVQLYTDSLRNSFKFHNNTDAYVSFFVPKIYIGATYKLTDKYRLGILLKTEIYNKSLRPNFTISANADFNKWFSMTTSLSIMNNSIRNFGVGMMIGKGPVQFYVITDQLFLKYVSIGGIPYPSKTRAVSIRFGLNFSMKCKKKYRGSQGRKKRGIVPCPAFKQY